MFSWRMPLLRREPGGKCSHGGDAPQQRAALSRLLFTCLSRVGASQETSLAVLTRKQTGLKPPGKSVAPQSGLNHSPGLNTIPHVALSRPSPEQPGARKTWRRPLQGPPTPALCGCLRAAGPSQPALGLPRALARGSVTVGQSAPGLGRSPAILPAAVTIQLGRVRPGLAPSG